MRRQQTVWVCRQTNKVFLAREDFYKHLMARRASQTISRRRAQIIAAADASAAKCQTIEELEEWLDTTSFFVDFARLNTPNATSSLANFKFSNIRAGSCSNSHSAPRGLPENWGGRKPGVPSQYPGISCDIRFDGKIKGESLFFFGVSDVLKSIGVCTGTGGSGDGKSFRYDCIIWAQHFPELYRNLIAKKLSHSLKFNADNVVVSKYEIK